MKRPGAFVQSISTLVGSSLAIALALIFSVSARGAEEPAPASEAPEPAAPAVGESPPAVLIDGATPAERAQALLHYCASVKPQNELYPKASMACYAARLLTNQDTAYALAKLDAAAAHTLAKAQAALKIKASDPHALDPFDKLALMYTYLVVKDKIGPETAAKIRAYMELYSHKTWVGYGAMNYRLMEDGAGFLAAEEWPDLRDAGNLDARQIQAVTKARLLSYFDDIVHHNFPEYGSPIYLCVDMSGLKMMADYARDPEVQSRAALTLDAMFLDAACSWNQGYYIGTAGRAKYWGSNNSSPDAMDATPTAAWIYFGGKRPIAAAGTGWIESFWMAAPGRYSLPPIFSDVANDRSRPTLATSSVTALAGHEIRRMVYHSPSYSLASQWDLVPSPHDALFKESRRMVLKWISPRPSSTFLVCQENPRRPYALQEHVANAFGYGENPFSQYLQNRGALIGICNVPDNYHYWKLYAPFPTTGSIVKRVEKSGWIFCHGGTMLFGFHPPRPYTWGKAMFGCDVLWSDARKNGWILETSEVTPYAGGGVDAELERFAADVVSKTKIDDSHLGDASPRLIYTSLDGHLLDLTFRPYGQPYSNQNEVDGQPIQYTSYPLFDNPWVHQDISGDILLVQHGGNEVEYNFKSWTRKG